MAIVPVGKRPNNGQLVRPCSQVTHVLGKLNPGYRGAYRGKLALDGRVVRFWVKRINVASTTRLKNKNHRLCRPVPARRPECLDPRKRKAQHTRTAHLEQVASIQLTDWTLHNNTRKESETTLT
jgi:hypothetical protein